MISEANDEKKNIKGQIQSPSKLLFCLSTYNTLAYFRRGLFYCFLFIYLRSFLHLSITEVSLVITIPMLCNTTCQIFIWGRLSDKIQKRRIFVILGEIIPTIFIFLTFYFHSKQTDYKIAGYIIIGGLSVAESFWSMNTMGWSALISDLYPVKERSRIMAILTSIGSIGDILGILFAGMLYSGFFSFQYEGWGYQSGGIIYFTILIQFLSVIPLFFIPEGGIIYNQRNDKKNNDIDKIEEITNQNLIVINKKSEFNLKIFTFFILALIFINFGRNSIISFYPSFFTGTGYFDIEVTDRMFSIIEITGSFGMLFIGFWSTKINKSIKSSKLLIIGISCIIFSLLLQVLTPYVWLLFIAVFISGIVEIFISSSSYSYVSELIPEEKRGKLFGIYNSTFYLSYGFASMSITGPIIDYYISRGLAEKLSYKIGYYIAIILIVIGLLIFIGLLKYRRNINEKKKEKAE